MRSYSSSLLPSSSARARSAAAPRLVPAPAPALDAEAAPITGAAALAARAFSRAKKARTFVFRQTLAVAERVAPGFVEERALRAFTTPTAPAERKAPQIPGLVAHRFTVESNGEQLAVWDWGSSGPTVLLVHGWSSAAWQLGRLVAPLVRAGFTVAAFDQPAHNLSTGRHANLRDLRDAVRAVAAKLGPIYAIVGHSLGATAAALAAGDGLRVERLALLAPAAEPEYYVRGFARLIGLSPARGDGMVERIRRLVGGDLDALHPASRPVSAPTLIVHDPADAEVPFADARALARAWPHTVLRAMPDVGHRRILASPAVVREVVDFIAR